MNQRPDRSSLGGRRQAVLLLGVGFAIAWWCLSERKPPSIAVHREMPAPTVDAHRATSPASGATELPGGSHVVVPAGQPAGRATAVRKSRLSDWMRFRYEHSQRALSTEAAIRAQLDAPVSMREVTRACVSAEHQAPAPDIDISAEVEIRARDVTVRGWGCDANVELSIAGPICDCILEYLPRDVRVVIAADVSDEDLTSYEGLLSLRLWL
jgi:hypothetical protein